MVAQATDPEADRLKVYKQAERAIARTGKWKDYEAVKNEQGQILGYRKLRAGDWFVARKVNDQWNVEGPFQTKRLCLAVVKEKKASYVTTGVYEAGGAILFTRENAVAAIGREVC